MKDCAFHAFLELNVISLAQPARFMITNKANVLRNALEGSLLLDSQLDSDLLIVFTALKIVYHALRMKTELPNAQNVRTLNSDQNVLMNVQKEQNQMCSMNV